MGNVMGIAASGLRAAQQGMQVAAHNVANLAMPDAARLQVQRSSVAEGAGVQTTVLTAAQQDPSALVGDLLAARGEALAFAANASVIRRQDAMLGSLLDTRA